MLAKLAVIGSSNMDLVMKLSHIPAPGETVGDAQFSQHFGGKGANQAVAAARFSKHSQSVLFITCLGDDLFGQQIQGELLRQNICSGGITLNENISTGTATICVDTQAENAIAVAPGANGLCTAKHLQQYQTQLLKCEYWLLQNETPSCVLAHLARLKAQNKSTSNKLIYNPAPARDVDTQFLSAVDVLILNEAECRFYLDLLDTQDQVSAEVLDAQCRAFHDIGVGCVILTLGAKGLYISDHQSNISEMIPALKVDAIDTTGAGDTFCGTFVAALAEGYPLLQASQLASCAAAHSVTELGAQQAIPVRKTTQDLFAQAAYCG